MLAKLKVIGAIIVMLPTFAWAQDAQINACEAISKLSPSHIRKSLTSFSSDILGKPADLWTYDDFMNLQQNAVNCHGYPPGVEKDGQVNAREWQSALVAASKEVLAYSAITQSIHKAYKPHWKWGKVPSCLKIVEWKRDPVWFTDNSKDIFGAEIRDISAGDRVIIGGFAKECLPVAERALANNQIKRETAAKIVEDILASIARENEADKEDLRKIAPSLQVEKDGRRIPLAYVGPTAKTWIDFANKFELSGQTMRVEDLITISKWIDLTDDTRDADSPDIRYAKAMREIVSRRMFGRD